LLTVDYERLGVQASDRLLDLGCGAGRHAFEAMRLGADVTALDLDEVELKQAAVMMGEIALERDGVGSGRPLRGSALELPFPDATFDRVIAAEVLEHIPNDEAAIAELSRVLRPGGTMAVTVPRWFPELLNWALSDEYPAPKSPGGHVRIYREGVLGERLEGAGLERYDRHHAHGLHAPYWWLKCAVGLRNDEHRLVRAYHRVLVDEIMRNPLHLRVAERVLQPVVGKSLVVYSRKTSRVRGS
jgi:SAM-dependent methyltransferase